MPSQCRILSTCWNCYFLNLPSLACERCEKQGHLFKTFFLLKTFCLDHFFSRLNCAVFLFFCFTVYFVCFFFTVFLRFVSACLCCFCFFNYFLCFSIFLFLYFCVSLFLSYFFWFPVWLTGVSLFFCFFVFIYVLIPTCCGMGSSCCVYHC